MSPNVSREDKIAGAALQANPICLFFLADGGMVGGPRFLSVYPCIKARSI